MNADVPCAEHALHRCLGSISFKWAERVLNPMALYGCKISRAPATAKLAKEL